VGARDEGGLATVGGRLERLPLGKLRLDPQNPRLPREMRGNTDQAALASYIARKYHAIEIARSIASNGYFESEPLIAVRSGSTWRVVEGNRRLTALKVLTEPALRTSLPSAKEWARVARKAQVPDEVPVVVASKESDIWPIIGYRHISGIEPWGPYAKAQFIASRVDAEVSWEQVAVLVGESETSVRSHYRNFKINEQARDVFKVDVSEVEAQFGTFTRAMSSIPLRAYIGAPAPKDVRPGFDPLARRQRRAAAELLSWLFGVDGQEPVISESRELTELAIVVSDPGATKVLRQRRDLLEAYLGSPGQRDDLAKRLKRAEAILRTTLPEVQASKHDDEICGLVKSCASAARSLTQAIK
jgi:hypothetical protein